MEALDLAGAARPRRTRQRRTTSSSASSPRPNIASKRWVYRQYDQRSSRTPSSRRAPTPPSCASKGTAKGIALTTDGNGRYCYIDPYRRRRDGRRRGRAQRRLLRRAARRRHRLPQLRQPGAARRLLPDAGSDPRHRRRLRRARHARHLRQRQPLQRDRRASPSTRRRSSACSASSTTSPVTAAWRSSGKATTSSSSAPSSSSASTSLAGSEYLKQVHGLIGGRADDGPRPRSPPPPRRPRRSSARTSRPPATTAPTAASRSPSPRCRIAGDKGLDAADANLGPRLDAALFGEAQSRIVVAIRPERRGALEQIARAGDVPFARIGRVAVDPRFRFGPIDLSLDELRDAYEDGLERALTAPATTP